MRVVSMQRLGEVAGWRALIIAMDGMGDTLVEAQRLDDGEWLMTKLGGMEIHRDYAMIHRDTQAYPLLEEAVKDAEAGREPGVTTRERRKLIG